MQDTVVIPVGQSKQSWNLHGGYQVASVLIDNPTGCWLFIPQDNTYVRPYTLGFAHTFSPTIARVDILFAAVGPDQTESVILGDTFTATISDTVVGNSEGQHFRPVIRTRALNAATVGGNIVGAAYVGANVGRYIAAVRVDNPNGGWRQLLYGGLTAYIPPYAIAWYLRLQDRILSVDLNFAAVGPAGEVSTQAGDVPTLTLFDNIPEGVDTSGKPSSFIEHFTPINTATILQVLDVTTGTIAVTLAAAVANRRHRILTFSAHLIGISSGGDPGWLQPAPAFFFVLDSPGSTRFSGLLTPENPTTPPLVFGSGLDCAVGSRIDISMGVYYANVQFDATMTYQTI